MSINYDPDGAPEITRELIEEAKDQQFQIISVICDEPGAKIGDPGGVSFFALVPFLPRSGDKLSLEDGSVCIVKSIIFKMAHRKSPSGRSEAIYLIPNVYATKRLEKQEG